MEGVGIADKVIHPKISLNFLRQQWGRIVKLSPNKLSNHPKCFQKVVENFILKEVSTD